MTRFRRVPFRTVLILAAIYIAVLVGLSYAPWLVRMVWK